LTLTFDGDGDGDGDRPSVSEAVPAQLSEARRLAVFSKVYR
jgi:hypothetical protein